MKSPLVGRRLHWSLSLLVSTSRSSVSVGFSPVSCSRSRPVCWPVDHAMPDAPVVALQLQRGP
ncbi:MAG: hypothetical protein ACFHWZ_11000 [Phycisphaerales bacterium]